MLYPKPIRRRVLKKQAERRKGLSRAQCRQVVYRRERMRCQRCGRQLTLDAYPWQDECPHVNEIVPRSKGGDPCDPENCELCCGKCHMPGGQHAPTVERMRQIQKRLKKR